MKKPSIDAHYLGGSSFVNFVSILAKNKFRIHILYIPRMLSVLVFSLVFAPLHFIEKIFNGRIKRTKVKAPPIFIIGHPRSGTTYMHNLLTQDQQFTFPTTYQCLMPGMFLTGGKALKALFSFLLPEKRPVDNVKLHADFPQEEEFAINALSPYSYLQVLAFPENIRKYFIQYGLLETEKINKWKNCYYFFMKKVAYAGGNKQIVTKNPSNTCRVKIFLEMYPGAKFIYMKRDKVEVQNSTFNLYKKLLGLYKFQKLSDAEIEENMYWLYDRIITAYEEQKKNVPEGDLIEIEYKDLVSNPLKQMETIYAQLNLSGYEKAKSNFSDYIETQRNYKPNTEQFLNKR